MTRPNPWRVTIVFGFYAFCATASIYTFSDVRYINDINSSVREVLRKKPYKLNGNLKMTIANLSQVSDIPLFIRDALLPQLMIGYNYGLSNTILSFNQITNQPGFCQSVSVMTLTVRRMKLTTASKESTTERFDDFYPKAWKGNGIPAGSPFDKDNEESNPLWGEYGFDRLSQQYIPDDYLGYRPDRITKLTGLDKSTESLNVHAKWDHTPPCSGDKNECPFSAGYKGQGGYVAAIVISQSAHHLERLDRMRVAGNDIRWDQIAEMVQDQYVYLLSPNGDPADFDTPLYGTCAGGVKATHIMRFQDFLDAGYMDTQAASVAVNFFMYNANKQTISEVELKWDILYQGVVDSVQNPNIYVDTIKLDLHDTYYWFWELIYIIGTVLYFLELFVYKLWKDKWKLFEMIWTYVNTISIVCSVISISFRLASSSENGTFLEDSQNWNLEVHGLTSSIRKQADSAMKYRAASAIAVLTIWLRVVELLARTPPRVKLLEATLIKALGHMLLYFAYILVIIVGFWSFATVHFAAHSVEFTHPFRAFISVFELLCLNVQPYGSTITAPLRRLFFIPYMLFAIVSVQMFNSIINYAYNRVSEDMEPEFKKAAREKKSKDRQERGVYQQAKKMFTKIVKVARHKLRMKSADGDGKDLKTQDRTADVLTEEDLQPVDKEKVEAFTEAQKKQAQGESFKSLCGYVIFAICYLMFLVLALDVGTNGMINEAVSGIFQETTVSFMHPSGQIFRESLEDLESLQDLSEWITNAIPQIVFDSVSRTGGYYDNKTNCIANWNCLVAGRHSPYPLIRVTNRLKAIHENKGMVTTKTLDKLPKARFAVGKNLVPSRSESELLNADDAPDADKENLTAQYSISWDGRQFCSRDNNGGYKDNGGIVCMLEAHPVNMTRQLETMQKWFYTVSTGVIVLEMIAYNGNSNGVIYIALKFTVSPTGRIMQDHAIESFSLLPIEENELDATTFQKVMNVLKNMFQISMMFGFVYIVMTIFFIVSMFKDLQADVRRKNVNEGKNCGIAVWEFFFKDVFHAMDTISYVISITSIALFIVWLAQQLQLSEKRSAGQSDFITFVGELAYNNKMYSVLSSINLLIIAVRPLKFLRTDARMAKINLTFWNALEDIVWFVIMLAFFFLGFVLFAHLMFGIQLPELAVLTKAFVYTFQFLIGQFDFWELWYVSDWAAIVFVFSFLFLFKFFFLNVFFAIIDKFFVLGETPPVNLKRNLKPLLGRLLRWVEWDDDYSMDVADKTIGKKVVDGPPSRAGRVHQVALAITEIRESDGADVHEEGYTKKSKQLADVCDADERMLEVMRWSRDEARNFVDKFRKLFVQKSEVRNDDVFLTTKVAGEIYAELKKTSDAMNEAERHQRYAILINEAMERRDQEILAKYILRLEDKITKKSIEMKALMTDVYHLRAESEKMRYADDDPKRNEEEKTHSLEKGADGIGAIEDVKATRQPAAVEEEESDGEYAEAPPASYSGTDKPGSNKVFSTLT